MVQKARITNPRQRGANSAGKGIVDQIVFEVEILKSKPRIGQKEELLHQRPEEFRYLLSGNYKIIYWIAKTELVIAMVFDSRQNPTKLKRLKS